MFTKITRTFQRTASTLNPPPIAPFKLAPTHLVETATDWFEKANALSLTPHEAIPLYKKSIYTHPTSSAHYNLAVCLYTVKDVDGALDHFLKSVEVEEGKANADAHLNIANIYALHFKNEKYGLKNGVEVAVEHLERAVKINTQDGEIRFNLGVMLESCGRLEDALVQYETSVGLGVERAQMNVRNCKAKLIIQEQEKK